MEYILFEQDGYIGTITMNRPGALNALNEQMLEELDGLLDQIACGKEIRCLVLTGAGSKAFVAGADIAEMKGKSKAQARAYGLKGNAVFRKLETLPIPVIAAVNGYALGGGCELSLACDIRLAADKAVFAQPEVGLGITAGFGGTQRLPRVVGPAKARELLYTAWRIPAQEAQAIGLVNAVYPADELMDEVYKMAACIADNAPVAVRATKQAINEGAAADMDAGIRIEAEYFSTCFETLDQQEAMGAFLEKRRAAAFQNA